MNVLQLIQSTCYEANLPAPVSGLAATTDPAVLQLVNLLYAAGRELLQAKCWVQLKRTHTITCTAGDTTYPLPSDYYCSLLDTFWDQTNRHKMGGPASDSEFNNILYGYAFVNTRKFYRVFGKPGTDQIQLNPNPATGDVLTFDYISSNWIATAAYAAWQATITADTNIVAFDDDIMILGLKYKFYREKNWSWQPYYEDFKARIAKAQARYQGSQKTSLYPAWGNAFANYPEGNFGL